MSKNDDARYFRSGDILFFNGNISLFLTDPKRYYFGTSYSVRLGITTNHWHIEETILFGMPVDMKRCVLF